MCISYLYFAGKYLGWVNRYTLIFCTWTECKIQQPLFPDPPRERWRADRWQVYRQAGLASKLPAPSFLLKLIRQFLLRFYWPTLTAGETEGLQVKAGLPPAATGLCSNNILSRTTACSRTASQSRTLAITRTIALNKHYDKLAHFVPDSTSYICKAELEYGFV